MKKIIKNILFILYIFIYIIYFIRPGYYSDMSIVDYFIKFSNFIPFHSLISSFQNYLTGYLNLDILVKNIIGNLIYFMPFVYFLYPYIQKKKTLYITCFCLILNFEIMQIVFKNGIFDVDDIILNFFGVVIASLIYEKVRLYFSHKKQEYQKAQS